MPGLTDLQLMAHLFRRAGFGATRDELEAALAKGYDATVEELLHPEVQPEIDYDLVYRFYMDYESALQLSSAQGMYVYRMINSKRPLEEKMVLFWHNLFATGWAKLNHAKVMLNQNDMFRRNCLGNFHTTLLELSRDPAMIFWLDNKDSHKTAPNENYGRELMELFSLGVGNYTEEDVKNAARAFTGWTMANFIPQLPYGRYDWEFEYRPEDHDDSEKTFLGQRGRLNGTDIIDIIVRQPATAMFIAKRLHNWFVSDEPDQAATNVLAEAYLRSHYDIRSVMRTLFHSDFFKSERAYFAKVKSPAEVVVGTMRLVGAYKSPEPGFDEIALEPSYMGQDLLNPPSVEGWHTGKEWIDTGCLVERINFVAGQVGDITKPGIRATIDRVERAGKVLSPERFVDTCLDLMGPLAVAEGTRAGLLEYTREGGDLRFASVDDKRLSAKRIGEMLQLIVAAREYQFA